MKKCCGCELRTDLKKIRAVSLKQDPCRWDQPLVSTLLSLEIAQLRSKHPRVAQIAEARP